MKFTSTTFFYLVIILLSIVIVIQRISNSNTSTDNAVKLHGKTYQEIEKDIDTVKITVPTIVYKPGNTIYRDTAIYIEIPQNIDTFEILRNYFSINIFKDTLKLNDSLGYVYLTDSISKNSIQGRIWNASVIKQNITEKIYLNKLSSKLFTGISLGIITNNFNTYVPNHISFGVNMHYLTKKDKMYGINLGMNSNISMYAIGSMSWKIKLHK